MNCSRCACCKGQGKIVGLGCIERDCVNCAGVGYISAEPVPKKRTRRPKSDICPTESKDMTDAVGQ